MFWNDSLIKWQREVPERDGRGAHFHNLWPTELFADKLKHQIEKLLGTTFSSFLHSDEKTNWIWSLKT